MLYRGSVLCRHFLQFYLILPSFFFNDTAATRIYTLSLHDALPISTSSKCVTASLGVLVHSEREPRRPRPIRDAARALDRKSTRLNSSHVEISYAVFCLKKKKKK